MYKLPDISKSIRSLVLFRLFLGVNRIQRQIKAQKQVFEIDCVFLILLQPTFIADCTAIRQQFRKICQL